MQRWIWKFIRKFIFHSKTYPDINIKQFHFRPRIFADLIHWLHHVIVSIFWTKQCPSQHVITSPAKAYSTFRLAKSTNTTTFSVYDRQLHHVVDDIFWMKQHQTGNNFSKHSLSLSGLSSRQITKTQHFSLYELIYISRAHYTLLDYQASSASYTKEK